MTGRTLPMLWIWHLQLLGIRFDFIISLCRIFKSGTSDPIVTIGLSQIPSVLFSKGWSNYQLIMNYCKTDEQRLFYMLYAGRERLEYKSLDRAIKTDAMSAILGSREVMQNQSRCAGFSNLALPFYNLSGKYVCKKVSHL